MSGEKRYLFRGTDEFNTYLKEIECELNTVDYSAEFVILHNMLLHEPYAIHLSHSMKKIDNILKRVLYIVAHTKEHTQQDLDFIEKILNLPRGIYLFSVYYFYPIELETYTSLLDRVLYNYKNFKANFGLKILKSIFLSVKNYNTAQINLIKSVNIWRCTYNAETIDSLEAYLIITESLHEIDQNMLYKYNINDTVKIEVIIKEAQFIKKIYEENVELKNECADLKNECANLRKKYELLETHIKYKPGGEGADNAETEFLNMLNTLNNINIK